MPASSDDKQSTAASEMVATPHQRPFQFRLRHLLAAVSIVAFLLALTLPAFRAAKEASDTNECEQKLRWIGLALQNYHDTWSCFPPAYQCDASGNRVHSWRLLIWNFLEAQPYSDTYDYGKAWNHPSNAKLARHGAFFFRCPADRNGLKEMTNYVAAVGPETMWPGDSSVSIAAAKDGGPNTIMVVEIANSDIHWMEPRDLPIEELSAWLDPNHRPTLLASHRSSRITGGMVVFADGHTEFLPHDVTERRLRGLLSRAGNESGEAKEE